MNERIYTPLHDRLASDTSARRGDVCRGENHSGHCIFNSQIPLNGGGNFLKSNPVPSFLHKAHLPRWGGAPWRVCMLLPFLLLPALTGCGDDALRYVEMEEFYVESRMLPEVSLDSVNRFSGKVDSFVGVHPDAVDDPLYPKIQDNIRSASIRITITVEDAAWKDTLYYTF